MNSFVFSKKAEKKFLSMPQSVQKRVLDKLKELKSHEDLLSVLKRLHHFDPATHRLRVGNYRLILELKQHNPEGFMFLVLDLGDRKNVYK